MKIEIFDVEHGACALVTGDNNIRMLIDCGHNASTNWYPGRHLRSLGITQIEHLLITNYDEDHVSGLVDFYANVNAQWLWRNVSVGADDIKELKTEDGYGPGIEKLIDVIRNKYTGPSGNSYPQIGGVEIQTFRNTLLDFDDENNLSLVAILKCHGWSVIFPGDMENAGWLKLLEQQAFRQALNSVHFFVASHHGRETGKCDDVFASMAQQPKFVIISDKAKGHQSQETTGYYAGKAAGGPFRGDTRYVLTTRSDGDICIEIGATSWGAY